MPGCPYICVKDYINAATCPNYLTDQTACIQSAINAAAASNGGTLYFPPGTYTITSTLTISSPLRIVGAGRASSTLFAVSPNFDYISVASQSVTIEHIGFLATNATGSGTSSNGAQNGSFVNFTGSSSLGTLNDFKMIGGFYGITLSGLSIRIVNGTIQDVGAGLASPGGGGTCGILVVPASGQMASNVTDNVIDKVVQIQTSRTTNVPSAAFWIRACADLRMTSCGVSQNGAICLLISGGEAIYVSECFFDDSVYGIVIEPVETTFGQHWVARSHFSGNWTGAHQYQGVLIAAPPAGVAGYVDTLTFTNHHASWNGADGILIQAGSNISISNGNFNSNGPYQTASGGGYVPGANGISIDYTGSTRTVTTVNITGNICGFVTTNVTPATPARTYPLGSPNLYRTVGNEYGIKINSSICDYIVITGNSLSFNNSGGITSPLPTHNAVGNNLS